LGHADLDLPSLNIRGRTAAFDAGSLSDRLVINKTTTSRFGDTPSASKFDVL